MPKWTGLLLVGIVLLIPTLASAQAPGSLSKLEVDLWPEYDRAEMLVIYHIFLDPAAPLPANLTLRIPAAVGDPYNLAVRNTDNNLYKVDFTRSVKGDWSEITFSTPRPEIQLEYYDSQLAKNGANRSYTFVWPGGYSVKTLTVQVQQPYGATGMQISPAMGNKFTGGDGLEYFTTDIGSIPAQQNFSIKLSYQKTSDELSVQFIKVGESSPIDSKTPGRARLDIVLWGTVGLVAVLLIAGGAWWYWRSGQESPSDLSRKRHLRSPVKVAEPVSDGVVFCHRCGKRALPEDIFCRSCGTQLRRDG